MKHMRARIMEPKPAPDVELEDVLALEEELAAEAVPLFTELGWEPGGEGLCEWAEVDFPNGWRATFLRGEGKNASIHMNPDRPNLYVGPYEIQAWDKDGNPCVYGPEGEWPKHGREADMQALMDLIGKQPA